MTTTTKIYLADSYAKGCPSNSAGRRCGVGLTAAQAIADCEPWANQAPYFKRRAHCVLAVDGTWQGAEEVTALIPQEAGLEYTSVYDSDGNKIDTKIIDNCPALRKALGARVWSEAIRLAVEIGAVAAPAHRPRRDPAAARVVRSYRVHPDTARRIVAESERTGESQGQIIDRLAAGI